MAFRPDSYNIEDWIRLEADGILQKICNIFDDDGYLVEQYKTRVFIKPVGIVVEDGTGRLSTSAPSLYRSFSYDEDDNQIASLPSIKEWTQDCEDAAQGFVPGSPPTGGVPSGLKIAATVYAYNSVLLSPMQTNITIITHTVPTGEKAYLRHVPVSGQNKAKYTVYINESIVQVKRTYYTEYNEDFRFDTSNGGILLVADDVVTVKVDNNSNSSANFNASIGIVRA
jgi:hypothetical protein